MKYYLKIFFSLFIPILLVELIFKISMFNTFGFETLRIILFTLEMTLILSLPISLIKGKKVKIIISLITFLSSIYALIEISFKNFMGNFMSLSMISSGDATRISNEFITFISEIKLEAYLCLLPFIILIIVFIFKKLDYEVLSLKSTITIISLIIVVVISSRLSLNVTNKTQIKSNKELYENPTLMDVSLSQFGINRFFLRDLNSFIFKKDSSLIEIDQEDKPVSVVTDYSRVFDDSSWNTLIENEKDAAIKNLHQYYINQNITEKNEYTGIFKDKNLILIMTEALDMSIINENLTPTLYRLIKEGWYFDNYYAPKFSCTTGESEFIAETSIIPSNTVCTPHTYIDNDYTYSIFNLFNNKGYTSTSYHGWSDKYYPRTKLHANMGSTFYNADKLGFSVNGGWTSDLDFMKKSYEVFKDTEKSFNFLITVSMHFSYDFDDATTRKNWNLVKDLNVSTSMKRYLAKAVEYDLGLTYLIDTLQSEGKLDDYVIVIFGDHHPYNLDFKNLADLSYIDRYENLNEDRLPFLIYSHSEEPMTISKTMSTFDILPTIANLFDLDYDPRLYIGTDVFSKDETIAIFPNGNWITDNAVYFAGKNKYELFNDSVDSEYITKINKIVNNKFTASDATLKKDYFKYLKR